MNQKKINQNQPNLSNAPQSKRIRFRFGLLTMLLVTAIAAITISLAVSKPARLAAATRFLNQTKTEYETARDAAPVPEWQNFLFGEENLRPITHIRIYKNTTCAPDYWQRFLTHSRAMSELNYLRVEGVVIDQFTHETVKNLTALKTFTCSDCKFEIPTAALTDLVAPDFIYLDNSGFNLDDAIFLRNKFPQTFVVVVGGESKTD